MRCHFERDISLAPAVITLDPIHLLLSMTEDGSCKVL